MRLLQSCSLGFIYWLTLVFVLQQLSLHWETLIMLLSQLPWLFNKLKTGCPNSTHSLWLFLCWLGWSLWSFKRCSMGGYFWTVLPLLLVNFMSVFRLEMVCVSLIVSIRSNLTHLCFLESIFFVFNNTINHLNLKYSSDRLVVIANRLLKLPSLHILLKKKSPLLPWNFALRTFSKLLVVFSTKVILLQLLYSTARRCCLMHLIMQNCSLKPFLITLMLRTLQLSLLDLIWNCIIFP